MMKVGPWWQPVSRKMAPNRESVREVGEVVLVCRGVVSPAEVDRVAGAVGRLLAHRGVSGGARVRLTGPNGADGPMLVQLNLRIGDTPARVQATTLRADVQPALLRLDRQIRSLSGPWPDRTQRVFPDPAVAIDRTRTIGPAARRRRAVTNFVAGQFGSGNERLDQEMSRMVASSQ